MSQGNVLWPQSGMFKSDDNNFMHPLGGRDSTYNVLDGKSGIEAIGSNMATGFGGAGAQRPTPFPDGAGPIFGAGEAVPLSNTGGIPLNPFAGESTAAVPLDGPCDSRRGKVQMQQRGHQMRGNGSQSPPGVGLMHPQQQPQEQVRSSYDVASFDPSIDATKQGMPDPEAGMWERLLRQRGSIFPSAQKQDEPPEPAQLAPSKFQEQVLPEEMEALVLKRAVKADGLFGIGLQVTDTVPHFVLRVARLLDPKRANVTAEVEPGDVLEAIEDFPRCNRQHRNDRAAHLRRDGFIGEADVPQAKRH